LEGVLGSNPKTKKTFAIAEGASRPWASGWTTDPRDAALMEAINAQNRGIGFSPTPHLFDKGVDGRYQNSHAEVKALEATPGSRAVAASRPMCGLDGMCGGRLQSLARDAGKVYAAAFGERGRKEAATRVFFPDGHVDTLGHNLNAGQISQYAREAAIGQITRPLPGALGRLSNSVVGGLDSIPIQRASKALGPIGLVIDAVSIRNAVEADGGEFGENSKETVGGVVGGIAGGALMGAAMGSVVPGIGTVVGGVIGGIAGSILGEEIGGLL
jgi:phage tail tape-measure protein